MDSASVWHSSFHGSGSDPLYRNPAAAQFISWAMPTYQDYLLSVGICRASPVYQWLGTNSCLLLSASLHGATPTNRVYEYISQSHLHAWNNLSV